MKNAPDLRPRMIAVMIAALLPPLPASALPLGVQVVNGGASVATAGNAMTITNTPGAILHWQQFNVGANESVRFQQSSALSAVLNRVTGGDPSRILGALSSNGKVFLVNPSGVLFGAGARVDTAGFVASTLNIANADFLAGRMKFQGAANAGKVENQGTMTATNGGQIYLIAPQVENTGILKAADGGILLAAGREVLLVDSRYPDVALTVSAPEDRALNLGEIHAAAGRIGIYGGIVAQRGLVSADSAVRDAAGRIVLRATKSATLAADARLSANGPQGGAITVQAGEGLAEVRGTVSARGATGVGGQVDVLGETVGLVDQASIDVSGRTGGGVVRVGGDFQGKNAAVQNAQVAFTGRDTRIAADALDVGKGGKVIVWSDDTTRAWGKILARGGEKGGDGGLVETSGKRFLDVGLVPPDTGAVRGKAGEWLLDPASITIQASTPAQGGTEATGTSGSPAIYSPNGSTDSYLLTDTITTAMKSGDVTVQTTDGGITLSSDLNFSDASHNGRKLTLNAGGATNGNISLGSEIKVSADNTHIDLDLTAGNGITISGAVTLYKPSSSPSNDASTVTPVGTFSATATDGDISIMMNGIADSITAPGGVTLKTEAAGKNITPSGSGTVQTGKLTIIQNSGSVGVSGTALKTKVSNLDIQGSNKAYIENDGGFTTLSIADHATVPCGSGCDMEIKQSATNVITRDGTATDGVLSYALNAPGDYGTLTLSAKKLKLTGTANNAIGAAGTRVNVKADELTLEGVNSDSTTVYLHSEPYSSSDTPTTTIKATSYIDTFDIQQGSGTLKSDATSDRVVAANKLVIESTGNNIGTSSNAPFKTAVKVLSAKASEGSVWVENDSSSNDLKLNASSAKDTFYLKNTTSGHAIIVSGALSVSGSTTPSIVLDSKGDIKFGALAQTGSGEEGTIDLNAGGSIVQGQTDNNSNYQGNAVYTKTLKMLAGDGIGASADVPLVTTVNSIAAKTDKATVANSGGDIYISNGGAISTGSGTVGTENIKGIVSTGGSVSLTNNGNITVTATNPITAATNITLNAGSNAIVLNADIGTAEKEVTLTGKDITLASGKKVSAETLNINASGKVGEANSSNQNDTSQYFQTAVSTLKINNSGEGSTYIANDSTGDLNLTATVPSYLYVKNSGNIVAGEVKAGVDSQNGISEYGGGSVVLETTGTGKSITNTADNGKITTTTLEIKQGGGSSVGESSSALKTKVFNLDIQGSNKAYIENENIANSLHYTIAAPVDCTNDCGMEIKKSGASVITRADVLDNSDVFSYTLFNPTDYGTLKLTAPKLKLIGTGSYAMGASNKRVNVETNELTLVGVSGSDTDAYIHSDPYSGNTTIIKALTNINGIDIEHGNTNSDGHSTSTSVLQIGESASSSLAVSGDATFVNNYSDSNHTSNIVLKAPFSATGTVSLETKGGGISQANGFTDPAVTASELTITANGGSVGVATGDSASALKTKVKTLGVSAINTSDDAEVNIENNNDNVPLTLNASSANKKFILKNMTSGQPIVVSGALSASDLIQLDSKGCIYFNALATATGSRGLVDLKAGGSIVMNSAGTSYSGTAVQANTLVMHAGSFIGTSSALLKTAVSGIAAKAIGTPNGDINIENSKAFSTGSGTDSSGNPIHGIESTTGNVTLKNTGNVSVTTDTSQASSNSNPIKAQGKIFLDVTGAITQTGIDNAIVGTGTEANPSSLTLKATSIGEGYKTPSNESSDYKPLRTQVSQIAASASGDINLINTGDLTTLNDTTNNVPGIKSTSGKITLETRSNITVADAAPIKAASDIWLKAGESGGGTISCNGISCAGNQNLVGSDSNTANVWVTSENVLYTSANGNQTSSAATQQQGNQQGTQPGNQQSSDTSSEPSPPTVSECTNNPAIYGCDVVLPKLDTCTTAPTTPGCSAVLPKLDTCTTAPTTPGCSAVLPKLETCATAPTTPGCSAVLPKLDTCTTAPTTPGCSAVLPKLDTCTTAPTTPGCSAVLPKLDTCTTAPTTPGCSAVLPPLDTCTSAPTTPGCSAVLPKLDTCTTAPTTPGCSAVLPKLDTCTSAPTTPGCSAVLPKLDTCTTAPTTPGCSAVLPPAPTPNPNPNPDPGSTPNPDPNPAPAPTPDSTPAPQEQVAPLRKSAEQQIVKSIASITRKPTNTATNPVKNEQPPSPANAGTGNAEDQTGKKSRGGNSSYLGQESNIQEIDDKLILSPCN